VAIAKSTNPFRWFDSSPEVIRLVVMMYVKFPLSRRNVGPTCGARDRHLAIGGVGSKFAAQ
jgi:hypothetical protein